jgi:hypothetical protein
MGAINYKQNVEGILKNIDQWLINHHKKIKEETVPKLASFKQSRPNIVVNCGI